MHISYLIRNYVYYPKEVLRITGFLDNERGWADDTVTRFDGNSYMNI